MATFYLYKILKIFLSSGSWDLTSVIKKPQLTKTFLQLSTQSQEANNYRGEHWILIARMDKTYNFADFMGQK